MARIPLAAQLRYPSSKASKRPRLDLGLKHAGTRTRPSGIANARRGAHQSYPRLGFIVVPPTYPTRRLRAVMAFRRDSILR